MSNQPSYRPASGSHSLAVVSLVFGILAWCVLPFVGAIVAIICGHLARGEIRRATAAAPVDGDGMAVAGLVLGYAQLILGAFAMMLMIGVLLLGFGIHWH